MKDEEAPVGKPRVSVVVVTYNQYQYTEACLASLQRCRYANLRIYLVDNASEPAVYEEFHKRHASDERVTFIRTEANHGFGSGCNAALPHIQDGYVVFLNNDTEVAPDWLEPIVAYMEAHPDVGACQPKIKDLKRRDYFEYAGAAGGFMDIYGYPFSRGRIFYTLEADEGQYDSTADLVWCSGTALVTKQSVLDRVGKFDEMFFMYGEESDLCWRMHHAGYRLAFIPHSVVYHVGGATMERYPKASKIFLLHRNGLLLLTKNYTRREWLKRVPIRMLLDVVAFTYYLIVGHPENSFAIAKAYLGFLRHVPAAAARRWEVKRLKASAPSGIHQPYPLYPKSIIADYFLRGKRVFSELRWNGER